MVKDGETPNIIRTNVAIESAVRREFRRWFIHGRFVDPRTKWNDIEFEFWDAGASIFVQNRPVDDITVLRFCQNAERRVDLNREASKKREKVRDILQKKAGSPVTDETDTSENAMAAVIKTNEEDAKIQTKLVVGVQPSGRAARNVRIDPDDVNDDTQVISETSYMQYVVWSYPYHVAHGVEDGGECKPWHHLVY